MAAAAAAEGVAKKVLNWRQAALATAIVGALICACGGPAKPERRAGDGHDGRAQSGRQHQIPALGPVAASRALDDAIAAAKPADIVVYANRLVDAEGELGSRREAVLLAVDELSSSQLAAVWAELEHDAMPAAHVALRRALLAEHLGDDAQARKWLARVGDGADLQAPAAALAAAIDARARVDAELVAVLLPLSGRYARLGNEIRAAVELAVHASREVRVEFVDTGGEAAAAVAAVNRAVVELGAVAILGPVGENESRAAAGRAVELGIPIALLAPAAAGAAAEVGVFRLWSSPEWEAREAVRLAVRMGYDRLAILAPRDEQGRAQVEAFGAAVAAAGVRLVAAGHYDPTASDLEPDIKAFLGLDPKSNERLRRHLRRKGYKKGWKSFSPAVEFDLLFVPDEYQRAALVVAYLPFFNVEVRSQDVMDIVGLRRKHGGRVPQVVQLLGSSGWHHESIIPRGGSVLEGALVVDVFSGGDNEEFASEEGAVFAESFAARNRRPPSVVAAQAYDAALLVLGAARRGQRGRHSPRQSFVRALAGSRLDIGACGIAAVTSSGEIVREATLLRIDGGMFVLHEY